MKTNLEILNPSQNYESWYDEVLKPVPLNFERTHYYFQSNVVEVSLSDIKGCYHDRYANKTWREALENLKRFSFNNKTSEIIKNSVIKAKLIGNEIYIYDHHRPIIARFLGLDKIKVDLAIYKSK